MAWNSEAVGRAITSTEGAGGCSSSGAGVMGSGERCQVTLPDCDIQPGR